MTVKKKMLLLSLPLLAILFVVFTFLFLRKDKPYFTNGSVHQGTVYSIQLKEGWSLEEYSNHAIGIMIYDGKTVANFHVIGIKLNSNSFNILVGHHEDVLSQEDIPLETSGATLTKVVSQWWLSAAQQIAGEEQPAPELHYFYRTDKDFFIESEVLDESYAADLEEMFKTIQVDETSEAYKAHEQLVKEDYERLFGDSSDQSE